VEKVEVGSVWSILDTHRQRVEFTVQRIATENGEKRAFGVLASGRTHSFTVSALARCRRGARLVRYPDGHAPYVPPTDLYAEQPTKTASDFRRTTAPKGMTKTHAQMDEAFAMRKQGTPVKQIAAHFGVRPSRIATWIQRARECREDEANMRAMARQA